MLFEQLSENRGILIKTLAQSAALVITIKAGKGPNHSQLHQDIAASAKRAEVVGIISSIGSLILPEPYKTRLKRASDFSLVLTTACFVATALTDRPFRNLRNSSRGWNDLKNFGSEITTDFRRHMNL